MKEILCFGDSNTYGLIPGTTRRYDRETRWTGILAEKLYDKGYRIIEEGLCGRTSVFDDATRDGRNGAKVLPMLLETHAPLDQVVLMLGTNDCKTYNHASADRIGKGIEKLIQQIESGECNYDFIEVMACRRGCIMGGGQPVDAHSAGGEARAKGLYAADVNTQIKKSNENPLVQSLYDGLLKGKEHKLLHRNFNKPSQ